MKTSFAKRLVALVLDWVLYGVLFSLIWWLFVKFLTPPDFHFSWDMLSRQNRGVLRPFEYADWILGYLYFLLLPTRMRGATVGKKIMGIRVVALQPYAPLDVKQLFLREVVGKLLSVLTLGIGFLLALGKDGRALHDRISGTIVMEDER